MSKIHARSVRALLSSVDGRVEGKGYAAERVEVSMGRLADAQWMKMRPSHSVVMRKRIALMFYAISTALLAL